MRIRLDRLGDEPYTWDETLRWDLATLGWPELLELGPVSCRGRISRTTPGFLFQAELTFEQTLACTRCLEPVALPTTTEVARLVLVDRAEKGAAELEENDPGVLHLSGEVLETESLLAEQLHLSIPMKIMCRDDCAGLCAACGADLNAGPCDCEEKVDSRWAALTALRSGTDRSDS